MHLLFAHVLEYLLIFVDSNMDKENEKFANSKKVQPHDVTYLLLDFFASFSLMLLIKVLLINIVCCIYISIYYV